jgi:hypothetical protein
LHISCIWKNFLKDDCAFHNSQKDEDQNTDPPDRQLNGNVFFWEYSLELEQVNMNFLEAVQHFGTGLVWYNLKYERCYPPKIGVTKEMMS